MRTFGLIGYPLSHSFSQQYFARKFKEEQIDAQYLLFAIPSINDLIPLLERHPYLSGLNVTIPYKETVMPFLSALDPVAEAVGAVNVIQIQWQEHKPSLIGYNSDIYGFQKSLEPLLESHHHRALILGTGGASKAVAYVLAQLGIEIKFVTRSVATSNQIAYESLTKELMQAHTLVVNTTPLGMYPYIDNCPSIPYEYLTSRHLVYDLIYNPDQTLFLQQAEHHGACVKNGIEMLFLQAKKAWEIWNSNPIGLD